MLFGFIIYRFPLVELMKLIGKAHLFSVKVPVPFYVERGENNYPHVLLYIGL